MATSCDLYVLIIAAQQSDATEAEYAAAYADNPEKVLAFFLGDSSAQITPFRQLIDSRHLRVKKDSAEELVEPIVAAVREAIETGRVVRPALIADVDSRIERVRAAISDVPLAHVPRVTIDGAPRCVSEVIGVERQVALSGIGGSGKTTTASIAARIAAADGRVLPTYVEPSEDRTDLIDVVHARLHAACVSMPRPRWLGCGAIRPGSWLSSTALRGCPQLQGDE